MWERNKLDREEDAAAKIERSIHHQAQALRLAAAVGALLGFVLLAQALVRVASLAAVEHPTLRALGMTREQLVAVGVARSSDDRRAGGGSGRRDRRRSLAAQPDRLGA